VLRDVKNADQKINTTALILTELDPELWKYSAYIGYCQTNPRDYVCRNIAKWDGSLRALLRKDFGIDGNQT